MEYKGKKVFSFSKYAFDRGYIDDCWSPSSHSDTLIKEDEFKTLPFTRVTEIPLTSTLYFDQSSETPRSKLANTNFKRCIKIEKANYIVIHEENTYISSSEYYIIDLGENVGVISNYYWHGDVEKTFRNKLIDHGVFKHVNKKQYWRINYLNGIYKKPYILDSDLAALIEKTGEKMDIDTLKSLYDMLSSKDENIAKMAIPILQGYDASEYPLTMRFLLLSTNSWRSNTVLSKDIKERYKIPNVIMTPIRVSQDILYALDKTNKTDAETAISFVTPYLKDAIERQIKENFRFIRKLNISCDINVKYAFSDSGNEK